MNRKLSGDDAAESRASTPGSLPPEPVEARPNVSAVTPSDYPLADRARLGEHDASARTEKQVKSGAQATGTGGSAPRPDPAEGS